MPENIEAGHRTPRPAKRSASPARFRPGRQYALTWSIPDSFGGMTGALLHRSRAFVRYAARPVDVLTLDDRLDYLEVEAGLRRDGQLIDGMRLFNLWDWLRTHDAPSAKRAVKHAHTRIPKGADVRESRRGETVLVRERLSSDGVTALQTERFRLDGSLLASDNRAEDGSGDRSVILYDKDGKALRSWGSVWGIYRYWLDQLIGEEASYLLVDSKTAARFVTSYRRRNVVTMHVVHGSHRATGSVAPRQSRRMVLERLSDYDSIVVLTAGQRDDLISDVGPHDNVAVIPNGFELPPVTPDVRGTPARERGRGVMLASLTARKRVSHAARAVVEASQTAPVSLDVFGEGERRPLLEKTIDSLDASELVRLRGHDPAAKTAFSTADFTLLTSTSEGLPLALVEGMAAGCIPIAYDIPYGPADLIRHGRSGFLVPAGDVAGLSASISQLQAMSERSVTAMRRRAKATANRFGDRAVTRTWAREMEKAFERKAAAAAGPSPSRVQSLRRKAGRVKRSLKRLLGLYR